MTLDEWIVNGNTGRSSLTMWSAIKGVDILRPARPYDRSDFIRCYGLIDHCNISSEKLNTVAEKYPFWQPFIDNWSKLVEMYERNEVKELNILLRSLGEESDTFKLEL